MSGPPSIPPRNGADGDRPPQRALDDAGSLNPRRLVADLRHAFAVDPPGPAEPTPAQAAVIDRLCREVVRRRLTTPALLLLEMSRPLNFVTAQAIHFFDPLVRAVTDAAGHRDFATFLEQRGSIDHFVRRIEEIEAEAVRREKSSGM